MLIELDGKFEYTHTTNLIWLCTMCNSSIVEMLTYTKISSNFYLKGFFPFISFVSFASVVKRKKKMSFFDKWSVFDLMLNINTLAPKYKALYWQSIAVHLYCMAKCLRVDDTRFSLICNINANSVCCCSFFGCHLTNLGFSFCLKRKIHLD